LVQFDLIGRFKVRELYHERAVRTDLEVFDTSARHKCIAQLISR
jgi:hypothetical protein